MYEKTRKSFIDVICKYEKNLVLLFANYENYEFVTVFVCYCVICKYEKTFSYLEFIDVWVYQLMLFWCGFSSKVLMFNHFEGIILIQWPVLLLLVFYVGNGDDMWFQFHEMYNVIPLVMKLWSQKIILFTIFHHYLIPHLKMTWFCLV